MIAGGGLCNDSFLQQELIDEISLVIAPISESEKSATSFEAMDHHFINMITCAASHAKECGYSRIGVLATDGTVEADLYGKALHEEGITCFYPDKEYQQTVMSIIYEEIKKGEKGSLDRFETVLSHMKEKGCEAVILACTELSVLKMNDPSLNRSFVIDAMDALCKACITKCGGTYTEDAKK